MDETRTYCKLTEHDWTTFGGMLWGPDVTHTARLDVERDVLCNFAWIHFYPDLYTAAIFNPIHANFKKPVCWTIKVDGQILVENYKLGAKTLTTVKIMDMPELNVRTRLRSLARAILHVKDFDDVAKDYLHSRVYNKEMLCAFDHCNWMMAHWSQSEETYWRVIRAFVTCCYTETYATSDDLKILATIAAAFYWLREYTKAIGHIGFSLPECVEEELAAQSRLRALKAAEQQQYGRETLK